jgi:hypothetical protein
MGKNQRYKRNEGLIIGFLMGQLASAFFAIPTAALLWLTTNKHLAIWGPSGAFIGSTGFWLVLGFFAFVSVFLPNLFPSLLGKVWHGLIRFEQWF